MWMVRCDGGQLIESFLEHRMVSVGWGEIGSLSGISSRAALIARVTSVWPDYKRNKAVGVGSQLYKIAIQIEAGDRVVTYDPSKRIYHVGRIVGGYSYDPEAKDSTSHRRAVVWDGHIQRDRLTVSAKNTLGSTLSIFQVPPDSQREIEALLGSGPPGNTSIKVEEITVSADATEDSRDLLEDLRSRAQEFIKDKLMALDWEQMQELVAGVLRAMGYKTRVSPKGADRGKDIVASPDGLGLEQPRIVVEVKHRRDQSMTSQDIRSFLGGRHKDDKGLFVSTGGFSKDAKYEADRASIPLTLIDSDDLVEMIIENYEVMDTEARSLLPLAKIFWPS